MARPPISQSLRSRLRGDIASAGYSGRTTSGVTTSSIQSGVRSAMRKAEEAMDEVYDSSSQDNRAGWLASIGDVFLPPRPSSGADGTTVTSADIAAEEAPRETLEVDADVVTPAPVVETQETPSREEEEPFDVSENKVSIDVEDLEDIIRREASLRNIDPEIAIRLWRSEGGGVYQSEIERTGRGSHRGREASFGPFQLFTGGGLGNDYERLTGRNLLTDNTPEGITKQIQFSLDMAVDQGWTPWYGRGPAGIGTRDGLENAVKVLNWQDRQGNN